MPSHSSQAGELQILSRIVHFLKKSLMIDLDIDTPHSVMMDCDNFDSLC